MNNTRGCFTLVVQYPYSLLVSSTSMSDCNNTMLISRPPFFRRGIVSDRTGLPLYMRVEWTSKVTNTGRCRFVCFVKTFGTG